MKAIYIRNTGAHFVDKIFDLEKIHETRNRNTLGLLAGERVAIIQSDRKGGSAVVGEVTVGVGRSVNYHGFDSRRDLHCVPEGSAYDCKTDGSKYLYPMYKPVRYETPYPVPSNAIRHGRVWCEW